MQTLNANWVTEGRIDFEYKKYVLLAYLQSAYKEFNEQKIYPFLSELVFHYRNLIALKENTEQVEKQFPKQLDKLDFEKFKLHYEKMIHDDAYMDEINSIVEYAIPRISGHIDIAKDIYEEVENNITISSVGIVPIHNEIGYLLLKAEPQKETAVFHYELTIFENMFEKYRGLKTVFLETYPDKIYNYEEAIKLDLIKKHKHLPNPATYLLHCKKYYPFSETIFPVAKRRFVQFLQLGSA
ncbi:MAG: hypothetical protein H7Y00_16990 [Fimbriimonadaceae bacterium]|nr:hypothetical protein [Chitinophagales bacterium]